MGKPKFDLLSPYRGTERFYPSYTDEVPANNAFLLHLQETEEDGCLHDLSKTRTIVEAYANLNPPKLYEIIAVTEHNEPLNLPSNVDAIFLGYDLSDRMGDSLAPALTIESDKESDRLWVLEKKVAPEVFVFNRLIKEHFRPKLNKNILFDDNDTANFCLECMMSILNLSPQFYEPGNYEVVGVYKIV
ncbi:MAG: hypothetical protein AB9903_32000 [Vulcanimicrobiota bacterium]